MKDLYLKTKRESKDWYTIDIYKKTGKRSFEMKTLSVSLEDEEIKTKWYDAKYNGFLCLNCKDQVFRERINKRFNETTNLNDGHYLIKDNIGLCSVCANTENIFHKYIDYDDEGQTKLKDSVRI